MSDEKDTLLWDSMIELSRIKSWLERNIATWHFLSDIDKKNKEYFISNIDSLSKRYI